MVGPDLKPNCKVLFFEVEREERRGNSEIQSEKDVLFGHIDQFWWVFFFFFFYKGLWLEGIENMDSCTTLKPLVNVLTRGGTII